MLVLRCITLGALSLGRGALLFLMSSSSNRFQQLAACCYICCVYWLDTINFVFVSNDDTIQKLNLYYRLHIALTYCLFFIEWSSSGLSFLSLHIILGLSLSYQLYAYNVLEEDISELNDYLFRVESLPANYPKPLNFEHAVKHCNVASKVFKDSRI